MSEADIYNSVDPEITGEGADWAYSTCTGTKKALLIGINYVGTESELSGCVNDVLNLRKFITERWGYENENIVTVTDDPKVSSIAPTRKNINLSKMQSRTMLFSFATLAMERKCATRMATRSTRWTKQFALSIITEQASLSTTS